MSVLDKPAHHVGTHPAQPNHSQLHCCLLFHNQVILFLCLIHCVVRGSLQPIHGCCHSLTITENRVSGHQNVGPLQSRPGGVASWSPETNPSPAQITLRGS